jgi:integrase
MGTTFKAVVYADNKKQDGTYNVKIRVTHNRRSLKVSTNIYVFPDDLGRKLQIKNQETIDQTDDLIRNWRKIVNRLGYTADAMDVKQIVEHIKNIEANGDVFKLDFIEYGRKIASAKSSGTARTYESALNALERYTKGQPLDISRITAKFLADFEAFLINEPALRYDRKNGITTTTKSKSNGRAISHYLANIRHIHNEAKKEFNDEDTGVIRIPQSPFKKYTVKRPPKPKKRALSQETIQAIINLPDLDRRDGSVVDFTRRDLARDCFLLSFALAGMNAADLYDCKATDFDARQKVITYKRRKTRTRRADEAETKIKIETCVWPLVEKYIDPAGDQLFCFHKHYSTSNGFTTALNVGLRQVETAVGSDKHITFYAGRHSWATIGRSKALNIDKYTVHEGLNHVDDEMKITDIYVDKDYSVIWEANAKILGIFDWSAVEERANNSPEAQPEQTPE